MQRAVGNQAIAGAIQRFTDAECKAAGCSTKRCQTTDADFDRAAGYLDAAIAALATSPLSSETEVALRWYFRRNADTPTQQILGFLRQIKDALSKQRSKADFDCDDKGCSDDTRPGTTTGAFTDTKAGMKPGDVGLVTYHLCGEHFAHGPRHRAETLIHETGHMIGLSADPDPDKDYYIFDNRFRTLSATEALFTTESYALFASAISQGIPKNRVLSIGVEGGLTSLGGKFASVFVEGTSQNPKVHYVDYGLRFSATLLGYAEGGKASGPEPGAVLGLLGSLRIENPRPEGGSGFLSLQGGPSFSIREGSNPVGIELGVRGGYRWRMAEVGVGATYLHEFGKHEGVKNIGMFGLTVSGLLPSPL